MAASEPSPLHDALNRKLADVVAASAERPPWYEAWQELGPQSSEAQRLAVYQAIRNSSSLPEEAGFYLVSWQIDAITLEQTEGVLQPYDDRLVEIREALGLGEEEWIPPGERPPEYEEALRQLHEAWDALYAAKMDEYGEQEMARLFRTDREKFDQRSEAGRQFFHGAIPDEEGEDPGWLDELLEVVAGCVEAESPMGPLGMRYHEEYGFWEIHIYPTPVELVGGAQDGRVVLPGFSLDLIELQAAFDEVEAFGWNALGLNHPEGPHVSIEGVFQGHEVYMQVLAGAPEDEEPGLKLDTTRKPRRRG
jgi:hypothetical protein